MNTYYLFWTLERLSPQLFPDTILPIGFFQVQTGCRSDKSMKSPGNLHGGKYTALNEKDKDKGYSPEARKKYKRGTVFQYLFQNIFVHIFLIA